MALEKEWAREMAEKFFLTAERKVETNYQHKDVFKHVLFVRKGLIMESMKENRLFKRAYNRGKKQACAKLVIYYFPNKAQTRFGITVSKKIGKAVVRNRIRRLIREGIHKYEPQIKSGYDIVIVARGACVGATFGQVEGSLYELIQRAGLLKRVWNEY